MIEFVHRKRRLGTLGAVALIAAMGTACSGAESTSRAGRSDRPAEGSCAGIVRVNGHDYEPWPTVKSLKGRVTKHGFKGRVQCPGAKGASVTLLRIKGIPASQALFAPGTPEYKGIYVPAAEWGDPPQAPKKVQALLE